MEVGHGVLRKIGTVEDTELRSSKRRRKLDDPNFNQNQNQIELDDNRCSVEACSESSSCLSKLKHGELKVCNRVENEISKSKPLFNDSFSAMRMESSTAMKKSKSNSKSKSKSSSPVNSASGTVKMPSMEEIDRFFSVSEKLEQKRFSEKYNFDVVNDVPMEEGRYEWVKIQLAVVNK